MVESIHLFFAVVFDHGENNQLIVHHITGVPTKEKAVEICRYYNGADVAILEGSIQDDPVTNRHGIITAGMFKIHSEGAY